MIRYAVRYKIVEPCGPRAAGAGLDDGRGGSPLRWLALAMATLTSFSSYYESGRMGAIANASSLGSD